MQTLDLFQETPESLAHATLVIGGVASDWKRFMTQLAIHPGDVVALAAETEGGIQNIHTFTQHILLSPQFGSIRLGAITHAESLTPQAQNALLKLLEEPPARVRIILFTTYEQAVLPTIMSRCRRYYLTSEPVVTEASGRKESTLQRFMAAEPLAKDDEAAAIMVDQLQRAYAVWQADGRPRQRVKELERLQDLVQQLNSQTSKRLLIENFVVSSL